MKYFVSVVASLILVGIFSTLGGTRDVVDPNVNSAATGQNSPHSIQDEFEPIDNMHHFMEYISQPSYLALKEAMTKEPENRRGWKGIKSSALILAETSALVAMRVPEDSTDEQKKEWKEISLAVYNAGKALYKSSGDFEKATENYRLMIDNCNRCHQVFDNGKHQLEK